MSGGWHTSAASFLGTGVLNFHLPVFFQEPVEKNGTLCGACKKGFAAGKRAADGAQAACLCELPFCPHIIELSKAKEQV